MKKIIVATALAALTNTQANAVSFGNDVDESDYRDYIVQLELEAYVEDADEMPTAQCGGLLIAGEYIVSAAHCFGRHEYSDQSWRWYTEDGASNDITIYQGIDFHGDTKNVTQYRVIDFHDIDTAQEEALEERKRIEELNPYIVSDKKSPEILSNPKQDLTIIKLSRPIAHNSNAALLPSFDKTTDKPILNSGDEVTFRGWGQDEYGRSVSTMQETTLVYVPEHSEYTPGLTGHNTSDPENSRKTKIICGEDTLMNDNCGYSLFDFISLTPTRDSPHSLPRSGDSGTPVEVKPNQIFGFAKSLSGSNGELNATITHLTWYLKLASKKINTITSPTNITMHENDKKTHSFAVQNLTQVDETINPYVVNGNGTFSVQGCENKTLEPLEYCEITVSINSNADKTDAFLYLADLQDTRIPLSYDIANTGGGDTGGGDTDGDDTDGDDTDGDDTDGGDGNDNTPTTRNSAGGGGSFGWFSLLALFGISVTRRYSRH
jgi:gammaproteobacterial enzyme C-terminal transmembrane domain